MISYHSEKKYDMATLLMDSTSYLLTNEQFVEHLKSVAGILHLHGLYILEMSHPNSIFKIAESTTTEWEMEKDGVKVKIQWGGKDDKFDTITQDYGCLCPIRI